jgi:S-adenosylmethionine/arginine decarboxylase-like enzyme
MNIEMVKMQLETVSKHIIDLVFDVVIDTANVEEIKNKFNAVCTVCKIDVILEENEKHKTQIVFSVFGASLNNMTALMKNINKTFKKIGEPFEFV